MRATTNKVMVCGSTLVASLLASAAATAAPFAGGNLVIERVGDGTATLTSGATAVFLDEYTPAGTLVQSIALPTTTAGGVALTDSGTATSDGFLSLSNDGRTLLVPGYNVAAGTAGVVGTVPSTTANQRVVAGVGSSGAVSITTALTDAYSANNFRGVASADGQTLFTAGTSTTLGGIRTATVGGTTTTQVESASTNTRVVSTQGGQLYFSTGSGTGLTGPGVAMVGTGTPTTAGQTITLLAPSASPYGFFFADLSPTVAGVDTLYVADDGAATGIEKFSLVNGAYTLTGTVTAAGVRGLTGSVNPLTGAVSLFGTTGGSGPAGGGTLYGFTDTTGYNVAITGTAVTLATAATNTAFRGVAFAPTAVPEPATLGFAAVAMAGLVARRRRSV